MYKALTKVGAFFVRPKFKDEKNFIQFTLRHGLHCSLDDVDSNHASFSCSFFFRPDDPYLPPIIAINGLFLLPSLILGIRSVLGLFRFPDTIYINVKNELFFYDKKTEFKISNIKKIYINQIGAAQSYFIYYEVFFDEVPSFVNKRKIKRIILVESYDIKCFFSKKTYLLDTLINLGLLEEKIKFKKYRTKQVFGFKDKNYDD